MAENVQVPETLPEPDLDQLKVITTEKPSLAEYNPSERYPADFVYWKDFKVASLYNLVLLSLSIEPRTIEELHQLRDETDEHEKLYFGVLQTEFERRLAVIKNVAVAGDIQAINSSTGLSSIKLYRIKDFIHWAISADWHLPEVFAAYLSSITTKANPSSSLSGRNRREIKKSDTQLRYVFWQTKADELWAINPKLSKENVAKKISSDATLPTGYKKDFHTIRKHINKP